MFRAFTERRPWAVVLINLIFGPFIGMLYLGRGRLAFVYLGLGFVLTWPLVFFFPLIFAMGATLGTWLIDLPIRIIGAVHGAALARNRSETALPPYSRWYSLVAIYIATILVTLALVFALRTFLYQPFDIPSAAMEPSLNIGDDFFVSKRAYDDGEPQRGDVIVFHWNGTDYVKRIVGAPGDKVQMVQGRLVLNGKPVAQKRLADLVTEDVYGVPRPIRQYLETLPSGRAYKTLDLMDNSPEDNTQVFVVPTDSYFVLGDNRDNSDDSRLEIGFVPRANVLGKVVVKFADRQHKTMIWEPVN